MACFVDSHGGLSLSDKKQKRSGLGEGSEGIRGGNKGGENMPGM